MPEVFRSEAWLRFVQLRPFSRKWDQIGLRDDDLRALEVLLLVKPYQGPVVSGTGGVRKLRFAGKTAQRGKSGAYRIYYIYFEKHCTVVLITVFAKNEMSDLSEAGKNAIAAIVQECEERLGKGIM